MYLNLHRSDSPPPLVGEAAAERRCHYYLLLKCNINFIIQQLSRLVTLVLLHPMTTHYDNVNVKMI